MNGIIIKSFVAPFIYSLPLYETKWKQLNNRQANKNITSNNQNRIIISSCLSG